MSTPDDDPRPVPDVGYALDAGEDPGPRHGPLAETVDHHLRWLYLIDDARDTLEVFAASRTGRWLSHSRHPLDPAQVSPVLACGGYPRHGHRWQPTELTLCEGRDTTRQVTVQRCCANHPRAAAILRISDQVAQILAEYCEDRWPPQLPPHGQALPVIVRAGFEFDRLTDDTEEPIRLPRDADGWVLLAVDQPHPTTEPATVGHEEQQDGA